MIDFIKLNVSYLNESDLLNNSAIEWKQDLIRSTGELEYPIKGKYFNLDIKINPTRIEIAGSIHRLWNLIKTSQNQNYNDFNFSEIVEMVCHLNDVFTLDPYKTIIENLEIGLNIHTAKGPEQILNENLIVWRNMTPTRNKSFKGKGKYFDFETSQYYFKIYDKGKQYEQPHNILRVECKIIRNEFLRRSSIRTLSDLAKQDVISSLLHFLYHSFDMCILVDKPSPTAPINSNHKEIFIEGINPYTWQSLKGMNKKRFKERFYQTLELHELHTIKREIREKLESKGNELLGCYEMNNFQNKTPTSKKGEVLQNEAYIYTQTLTPRKCKITGIDISHQKGDSKFLSMATIRTLSETEPETFKYLLLNFSPKKPNMLTREKLWMEIAHNIRNRDSNKRHELIRKTLLYKNSLFPISNSMMQ